MKKSLILAGILAFVAIVIPAAGITYIDAEKTDVYLREAVIYGDESEAEGLTFKVSRQWGGILLWRTFAEVGEELKTHTEFEFCPDGIPYEVENAGGIDIYTNTNFTCSASGGLLEDNSSVPYMEVFREVASRTEDGAEHTEEIKLADYYPYYQIEMDFIRPDYMSEYAMSSYSDGLRTILTDAVKMTIPDDNVMEATVYKDANGEVLTVAADGQESVRLDYETLAFQDGYYASIHGLDNKGQYLPGASETGYGIYKVPFKVNEKEKTYEILQAKVGLVYPLEAEILSMKTDTAQENFILLIRREGQLYLQIVDVASCEMKQEICLGAVQKDDIEFIVEPCEQGILVIMWSGRTFFVEKEDTGYVLTVDYDLSSREEFYRTSSEAYAYDYREGRLALLFDAGYYGGGSVYVMILESQELKYMACYEHSLDKDETQQAVFIEKPYQIHLP